MMASIDSNPIPAEYMPLVTDIVLILVFTWLFANILNLLMKRSFSKISKNVRIDETRFQFIRRLVVMFIYVIGLVLAAIQIPALSDLGVSVLASAGVLAVVVGFAAQQALANIISGVFIALFEPFKVGDSVSIQQEYGTVEDITLRHTVIRTWEEKRIIIPNSKMGEEYVVNYSLRNPRILGNLEIGISYDSSIDKARKIMIEEALKHPDVLKEVRGPNNEFLPRGELSKVRLVELTDFSQKLRLYYWTPDKSTAIRIKFELLESIKKRFDKEGIEIPFPYHTLVYKKDLPKNPKK